MLKVFPLMSFLCIFLVWQIFLKRVCTGVNTPRSLLNAHHRPFWNLNTPLGGVDTSNIFQCPPISFLAFLLLLRAIMLHQCSINSLANSNGCNLSKRCKLSQQQVTAPPMFKLFLFYKNYSKSFDKKLQFLHGP